ncbi:helix-turn-helix domain-containing protein [Sphingobacterium sp.]|uniref:helix-turn-helix domain-containing protein n=1 Tax=Sphingobacterium sp. TaxID=341027 RepID=UPI0028A75119|nr:helix-turn-helix domain-containing protein [Sphingobacterium sp.]
MQGNTIFKISSKIKEIRKNKSITIQELANKAGVSKGLISQIENNRTIPSLPVLINIISSLEIDINQFFEDFSGPKEPGPVIVLKKENYSSLILEKGSGSLSKRITDQDLGESNMSVVLLELDPYKEESIVQQDAYIFKHIINGKAAIHLRNQVIELETGDSIFLDGNMIRSTKNESDEKCIILITYFFPSKS